MQALKNLSRPDLERLYAQLLLEKCQQEEQARTKTPEFDIDIVESYRGDPVGFIVDGLSGCLGPSADLRQDSWTTWRVVLKAAYGYGHAFTAAELELFKKISGDRNPPAKRVKELWLIVGRRGGKDSIASLIAAQAACYADEGVALRPGERAVVACFATDRDQAKIVYNFTKAYFEQVPELNQRVINKLTPGPNPIMLDNNVDIMITTSNFRAPRGRSIAIAIFDELAFWRDEDSATPDVETYTAVLGGMGMIPNAMVVGISTPYRQQGLLYDKWEEHFGKDNDNILVIQGDTRTFNPVISQESMDRDIETDPERFIPEYNAQWRRDLADYVSRDAVKAVTVEGRKVLPPSGFVYRAFVDPSGGQVDSMTMGIAHNENNLTVLDCILEAKPGDKPLNTDDVVSTFAGTLREYRISKVVGDRYGGEWVVNAFRKEGITYEPSELSKSQIYQDFLPSLNSGRCELLDIKTLFNQLIRLERRVARGGKESIDHPRGEHDDVCNAACGALLLAIQKTSSWDLLVARG